MRRLAVFQLLYKSLHFCQPAKVSPPTAMQQTRRVYDVRDGHTLDVACQCLLAGEVIALPTDTVYGLGCDANNEPAIQRLYDIKGRDSLKPVAICVKDVDAFRHFGRADHLPEQLLERLLPGAITIVVQRSQHLNNRFLNPSTTKIGIRIPDCDFIRRLCSLYDGNPIALTSANLSSEPSSLNVREFQKLWPKLGAICDAGQIGETEERRSASTVIDLSERGVYTVLRDGVALTSTLEALHDFGLVSK